MSNNDKQCVVFRSNNHYFESESSLNRVLNKHPDSIEFDAGDIIYTPAYKLQYVDEIVTPAVPAKPVEPYLGLTWQRRSVFYKIIDTHRDGWMVYYKSESDTWNFGVFSMKMGSLGYYVENHGYPVTAEVPAVTKTIRKWIKL